MNYSIKDLLTLEQLKEFLKKNASLIEEKENDFTRSLAKEWNYKILSKKLIEFHEKELAQKIDAINPYQSKCEVCNAIYAIILPPESTQTTFTSDEPFDYDEWKFNQILWDPDF